MTAVMLLEYQRKLTQQPRQDQEAWSPNWRPTLVTQQKPSQRLRDANVDVVDSPILTAKMSFLH